MKGNFLTYIIKMIVLYALIAFLPMEYTMILGASFFAVSSVISTPGSLAVMTAIGILMFSLFSADFLSGILVALSFIVPGIIQGFMIRGRKSLSSGIATVATARGALLLLYYDRMSDISNIGIKDMLIGNVPGEFIEKLNGEGVSKEVLDIIPEMIEFAGKMIPSVIVISALSFAFLSIGCTKLLTRNTPLLFAATRKLSDIKLDVSFVIVTFAATLLSFFVKGSLLVILLNCIYVFYVIYFAAGFAFTYRLLKKGLKNKLVAFLVTGVITLISFGMIMPLMGIIGAFIKTDYENFTENKEELKTDEERKED